MKKYTDNISISKLFLIINVTLIVIIVFITSLALYIQYANQNLQKINEQRYESYLLADEVHHNSDDLTKFARMFAITNNPVFEKCFYDIMNIENGKIARPKFYNRIYWDFVINDTTQIQKNGSKISLLQLMKNAKFTDSDLELLSKAKRNSDKLALLEIDVINKIKQTTNDLLSTNHSQKYSINDILNKHTDFDSQIFRLFDKNYIAQKAEIMKPIQEFYAQIDNRTALEIQYGKEKVQIAIYLLIISLLTTFLLLIFSYLIIRRKIVKPILNLHYMLLGQTPEFVDVVPNNKNELLTLKKSINNFVRFKNETETKLKEQFEEIQIKSQKLETTIEELMTTSEAFNLTNNELENTTEKLIYSEEKFRQLAENIDHVLWLNTKDKLLYLSPVFEKIFDIALEKMYENPKTLCSLIYQDDCEKLMHNINDILSKGINFEGEFRVAHPKKGMRWILVKTFNFNIDKELRTVGIAEDITEKKQVNETLKNLNRKFLIYIEKMPLGYIEIDHNFIIRSWNPFVEKIFGFSEIEAVGQNMMQLIKPKAVKYESIDFEYKFSDKTDGNFSINKNITKDCREIICEWHTTPLQDNENKITGWAIICQDITDRIKAEEQLYLAKNEAEKANKTKSIFLANVSHEIRTPMNSVIGFTDLLESQITDPMHKCYLESIKSSGTTLLNLINDILDLSKIEAGKLNLALEPADFRSVLREIEYLFSLKIAEKGLRFKMTVDPQIPKCLLLDELRLRQVLTNLISNAIKFTSQGFIGVVVKAIPVDDKFIDMTIDVQDTGIGIPTEAHETIFEAFSQQSEQDTRKYEGTGLGLSISKKLIELMNGEIFLASNPNEGSTFTIFLRRIKILKPNKNLKKNLPTHEKKIYFDKAKIIVADDLEINRQILKETLNFSPLEIFETENGNQTYMLAQQLLPDAILLDLRMPDMDGFVTSEMLKNNPVTSHIPIIAISTYSLNEIKNHKYSINFAAYLQKPIRANDLINCLTNFLKYKIIAVEDEDDFLTVVEVKNEIKNLSELINLLNYNLKANWQAVCKTSSFEEIKKFGVRIKETGEKHNAKKLIEFGVNLLASANIFDLENVSNQLQKYETMVKYYKNLENDR